MAGNDDDELWSQLYGEAPPISQSAEAVKVELVQSTFSQPGGNAQTTNSSAASQAQRSQQQSATGDYAQQNQYNDAYKDSSRMLSSSGGAGTRNHWSAPNATAGASADDMELIMDFGGTQAGTYTAPGAVGRQSAAADDEDLDLLLPSAPAVAPLQPAKSATAPQLSGTAAAEATARARIRAQEHHSKPPANGLVVPAPTMQRGLLLLDFGNVQAAMPEVNWGMPPAWPSEAEPAQPIKLPRQTKVQQAEYKEFLALGHGEIFELDIVKTVSVDRMGHPQPPPWMAPNVDLSDFFNFGMDTESWRFYCATIAAYRKQFSLLANPEDAVNRPIVDEDSADLPPNRQGGIAHPIATYSPLEDAFVFPNGFRRVRDPTYRSRKESEDVSLVLVECSWKDEKQEEATGPPIDYGSWHLFRELGMAGISDFPHYHFDPEADERNREALLSMYGAAMSSLNPGIMPERTAEAADGGMMGEDFPREVHTEAQQIGYEGLAQSLAENSQFALNGGMLGIMEGADMMMPPEHDFMSGNGGVGDLGEDFMTGQNSSYGAEDMRDVKAGGGMGAGLGGAARGFMEGSHATKWSGRMPDRAAEPDLRARGRHSPEHNPAAFYGGGRPFGGPESDDIGRDLREDARGRGRPAVEGEGSRVGGRRLRNAGGPPRDLRTGEADGGMAGVRGGMRGGLPESGRGSARSPRGDRRVAGRDTDESRDLRDRHARPVARERERRGGDDTGRDRERRGEDAVPARRERERSRNVGAGRNDERLGRARDRGTWRASPARGVVERIRSEDRWAAASASRGVGGARGRSERDDDREPGASRGRRGTDGNEDLRMKLRRKRDASASP